jgi:hypothetical protein
MAEGRPRLVAVPEPSSAARRGRGRSGRGLVFGLAALALVCAVGWGLARRESDRLGRELAATQGALDEATATLRAIEAQRSEARSQLEALASEASALAGRLTELRALLATDPAEAADAQPMRSEAELAD